MFTKDQTKHFCTLGNQTLEIGQSTWSFLPSETARPRRCQSAKYQTKHSPHSPLTDVEIRRSTRSFGQVDFPSPRSSPSPPCYRHYHYYHHYHHLIKLISIIIIVLNISSSHLLSRYFCRDSICFPCSFFNFSRLWLCFIA